MQPRKRGGYRRLGASNAERSAGPLYWFMFLCGIVVFVIIFGMKLSEFINYTDRVEEMVVLQTISATDEVLGLTDEITTDEDDTVLTDEDSTQTDEDAEPDPDEVAELVDEIEEERKETLRNKLLLSLPDETDNPNHPVTFVEPTEEGVEVQIDGSGFTKEQSPLTLPSLSIGKHTINFRFLDEDETKQNLEEQVIVIPRAPVWSEGLKSSFRSDDNVVLEGTALPRSKVILLISSAIITDEVEADEEGLWRVAIGEDLPTGEHTAVSFVRKDGYASNFSEPFDFTVGPVDAVSGDDSEETDQSSGAGSAGFGYFDGRITEDNYVMVLVGFGGLSVGLILFVSSVSKLLAKRDGFEFMKSDTRRPATGEGISLREKFAKAGVKVEGEAKSVKAEPELSEDENDDESEGADENEKEGSDKEGSDTDEDKDEDEKLEKKDDDDDKSEKADDTPEKEDEEKIKQDDNDEDADEEADKDSQSQDPRDSKKKKPGKSVEEDVATEEPKPGKVYSKEEFLKKFKDAENAKAADQKKDEAEGPPSKESKGKESNKIKISLTSSDR